MRVDFSGRSVVVPDPGTRIPCGLLPAGAEITAAPGARVARGQTIAQWDAFHRHAVAEHAGVARWQGLTLDLTVQERVDEVTGLTRRSVVDPEGALGSPSVEIVAGGEVVQVIALEAGDVLIAGDGAGVARGELIAKRTVFSPRVPDHVEGWRDLERLLYGKTDEPAVLAEIGGVMDEGRGPDGAWIVTLRPVRGSPEEIAAGTRRYTLPRWNHPLSRRGDLVTPGTPLSHGTPDPGDVARVLGPGIGALYLVDQIQLLYALFGVSVDVRHVEVTARALLGFVRIVRPGGSGWAAGDRVARATFARACDDLVRRGETPPAAEVVSTGLWRSDPGLPRRRESVRARTSRPAARVPWQE